MRVYTRVAVRRRHGLLASIGLAYVWLFLAVIKFALFAVWALVQLFLLTGVIWIEVIRLTERLSNTRGRHAR